MAVGAAHSAKLQGADSVALTFFGDGATNIGTFHEALNMAAVWKAPVVFIIENNLYGEYSPMRETTPLDDLAERAKAYAMPGVDRRRPGRRGGSYAAVSEAVARARAGGGPSSARDEDVSLPRAFAHRIRRSTGPRASSNAGRSAIPIDAARRECSPTRAHLAERARQRYARPRSQTQIDEVAARARRRAPTRRSRRPATMSTQTETALRAARSARCPR